MANTLHVYPVGGRWLVKRKLGEAERVFRTQKEALENAKRLMKGLRLGQIVVHRADGTIGTSIVHGLPKVLAPHLSSPHAKKIARAVSKVALDQITDGGRA